MTTQTRRLLIAGNWKMNKTADESVSFVIELKKQRLRISNIDTVLIPSFTSLATVSAALKDSSIQIGAQNIFYEKQGAFTGEISPAMLQNLGCSYTLVGHSERRTYFHETDDIVNKKILAALEHNITPILCVGETLTMREANLTLSLIKNQLENCLKDLKKENVERVIIAYEPLWAIGTGLTASPEQAQEIHTFIRQYLNDNYGTVVAESVRILYGGSVKSDSVRELIAKPDIDGVLVGGASLSVQGFSEIIRRAQKALDICHTA